MKHDQTVFIPKAQLLCSLNKKFSNTLIFLYSEFLLLAKLNVKSQSMKNEQRSVLLQMQKVLLINMCKKYETIGRGKSTFTV